MEGRRVEARGSSAEEGMIISDSICERAYRGWEGVGGRGSSLTREVGHDCDSSYTFSRTSLMMAKQTRKLSSEKCDVGGGETGM